MAAAPEGQSLLVEDFAHPGAEAVLAEHGLRVFKGDGHISFVTSYGYDEGLSCEPGQLQVERMFDIEPYGAFYCFETSGTSGYLTLEVPSTFLIRGGHQPVTATAEVPGEAPVTIQVPPGTSMPVAPGEGAELPQAILVELRFGPETPVAGGSSGPATTATVRVRAGAERACSGVLVQRWWVLTARSCFTGTPDGTLPRGAPTVPTSVTTGAGRTVQVDSFEPHSDRDLVLVRLASPLNDVAPVPLASTAAVGDDTVTAVGYSRTATSWSSDLVRAVPSTVTAVTSTTLTLQPTGVGLVCRGAAGGATLRTTANGGFEVVGIHRSGTQSGCLGADGGTAAQLVTDTRVDDLGAWVSAVATEPFEHVMGADWSGDGAADVLAVDQGGNLWYYPHNGNALSPRVRIGQGWASMKHVTAGDWNGDGRADIIAVDAVGALWLYEHTLGNSFAAPRKIGNGGWGAFKAVMATDWSGDGRVDVLGVDASGYLWYYPHNGDGLTARVLIGTGWGSMKHITAGDWSGDGFADVLAVDQEGRLLYYAHNGPGLSAASVVGSGWAPFAFVSVADWNRDGRADVLGVDSDGRLRGYLRSGSGLAGAFFIEGYPQLG